MQSVHDRIFVIHVTEWPWNARLADSQRKSSIQGLGAAMRSGDALGKSLVLASSLQQTVSLHLWRPRPFFNPTYAIYTPCCVAKPA